MENNFATAVVASIFVFIMIVLIAKFRKREEFNYGDMNIPGALADDVTPPESVVERILEEIVNVVRREQKMDITPVNSIFIKSFSADKIDDEALKGDFREHVHGGKGKEYSEELMRIFNETEKILKDDIVAKMWRFRTTMVKEIHAAVDNFKFKIGEVIGMFSKGEISVFEMAVATLRRMILMAEKPYQVVRAFREFTNLCRSISENRRAIQYVADRRRIMSENIQMAMDFQKLITDLMRKYNDAINTSTSVHAVKRMIDDNQKNGYPTTVLEGERRIKCYLDEIGGHMEKTHHDRLVNLRKSLNLDLDFGDGKREKVEVFRVKETEMSRIYIMRTIFFEKEKSRAFQIDSFSFANSFQATIKGLTTANYDDEVGDKVRERNFSKTYATKDEINKASRITKARYENM